MLTLWYACDASPRLIFNVRVIFCCYYLFFLKLLFFYSYWCSKVHVYLNFLFNFMRCSFREFDLIAVNILESKSRRFAQSGSSMEHEIIESMINSHKRIWFVMVRFALIGIAIKFICAFNVGAFTLYVT